MIVRINQIELARAEAEAGWPPAGPAAGLRANWPADARAVELLILGQDEQGLPLTDTFRHAQLRQMVPQAVVALRAPDEAVVVRLDGLLADGDLPGAFRHLTDPGGFGRFAVAAVRKLQHAPDDATVGSVRLQPTVRQLSLLCADPAVGFDRSVRLRAMCVPEDLVAPALEIDPSDDERWGEITARAGFVLSTTRGLRSLQILTRRYDVPTIRAKIMQRLIALAQPAGAVAGG